MPFALTLPWFSHKSKYPPRAANVIQPLINGQRAFLALHGMIAAARKSVEIISWGFDPSMRLVRPDGERLGDLLKRKAEKDGVDIRVLIWKNVLSSFAENNIPGDGLFGSGGATGLGSGIGGLASAGGGSSGGGEFNDYASGLTNSAAVQRGDDEARKFNRDWFRYQPPKLEFRTRDFSLDNRVNIIRHQVAQRGLANPLRTYLMADFASHHQKMVLVDYDDPALAAGLVMGHNLLRNYWDTDEHAYHSEDRLGFKPWQDLSALVFGGVLFDLNENFMTAWDKAQRGGKKLYWSDVRKTLKPDDFAATAAQRGQTEVAQIVRTQAQEDDRSIRDLYLIALANARSYVYFENQYFRYTAFANALRTNRRKLKAHGWTRDFYIFVVTNVPGGEGKLATYDMLAALGKSATMPKYEKQAQESDGERELRKNDLQGVNIHVCTLCASTAARVSAYHTPTYYTDIYVHSKLLLIDDAFFTLGSANINTRSMEGDSELNIACPSPVLAKQWREHLWKIHTAGGVMENMEEEFGRWDRLMVRNKDLMKHQETLQAPLIEFFDAQRSSFAAD